MTLGSDVPNCDYDYTTWLDISIFNRTARLRDSMHPCPQGSQVVGREGFLARRGAASS